MIVAEAHACTLAVYMRVTPRFSPHCPTPLSPQSKHVTVHEPGLLQSVLLCLDGCETKQSRAVGTARHQHNPLDAVWHSRPKRMRTWTRTTARASASNPTPYLDATRSRQVH